jgi:HTH-type transcriptional regulator, sugar sensing transcriptional regulator
MDVKNILQQFGLYNRKADVYLAALELGGASVIDISKKASIKRTTAYDILLDLQKDGLVSQTLNGKRKLFIGEDPEKIKKDLERKESLIEELLPELKSIYNIKGAKPKIRFYEGKEGLIEVYNDTLKYSGEILAFASEDVVKVLEMSWAENYVKQRIRKKIYYKGIFSKSQFLEKEFLSKDQEQMRSSKIIDGNKYPFTNETMIYGHQKVAIISAKDSMGIIIESAEIYRTQKSIFELLWDNLPEIKLK